MEQLSLIMILGLIVIFPMHKLKRVLIIRTWSWRKGKAFHQGLQFPSHGALVVILNFKERKGLLTTKCILWKEKWKVHLGKASSGWRIGIGMWFIACGDFVVPLFFWFSLTKFDYDRFNWVLHNKTFAYKLVLLYWLEKGLIYFVNCIWCFI